MRLPETVLKRGWLPFCGPTRSASNDFPQPELNGCWGLTVPSTHSVSPVKPTPFSPEPSGHNGFDEDMDTSERKIRRVCAPMFRIALPLTMALRL